mmetsp:Transcript_71152/g.204024  ORF Transcript_71152/g.204024 Transcript_71152/m.204024 type:complete len:242 (-) Transcript_71152:1501-2226(-)
MARCAPAPMATPTSAPASAGASLTPSPTKQTLPLDSAISASTLSAFCFGRASAHTWSSGMPTSLAMARAVLRPSPVHIHTSMPRCWRYRMVATASARTASRTATAPSRHTFLPNIAWTTTTESIDALLCAAHSSSSVSACRASSPSSCFNSFKLSSRNAKLPTRISTPPKTALTPRPTLYRNWSGVAKVEQPDADCAASTKHLAIGWSEPASAAPTNHQKFRSSRSVSTERWSTMPQPLPR